MNNYLDNIKPAIRAIKAYRLIERDCRFKLNQNENPFDLPSELKEEILHEFMELHWNRYPSFYNTGLRSVLSQHLNLSDDAIIVGNGSNELLQIVCNAVLEKGKKLLLITPTFSIYQQLGKAAGAEICEVELAPDWSFPVSRIERYVRKHDIALTIVCSPNSPTGSLLTEEELSRIIRATRGLILVDEAYHEFSQRDYLSLLPHYPNLIITRTFSKAMGLAGLRIGYLLSQQALIVELNKAKLPYNLDIFSELTARKLLENRDYLDKRARCLIDERNRVFKELTNIAGITVFPSAANFLMFSTAMSSCDMFEKILKHDILIRDISGYHPRLANTLRLSIGQPEENDALLTALRHIISNA